MQLHKCIRVPDSIKWRLAKTASHNVTIITAFSRCCSDGTVRVLSPPFRAPIIAALIKTPKQYRLNDLMRRTEPGLRQTRSALCVYFPSHQPKVSVVQTQLRIDCPLIFIRPVESAAERLRRLTEEMERSGERQARKEAERKLWEKTGECMRRMSREGRGRRSYFLSFFFKAGIRITREEIRRLKWGCQELREKWRCRDLETSLLLLLNVK